MVEQTKNKAGYQKTALGWIPEDWEVRKLSSVTVQDRPISYGIVQTGELVTGGVPCVRVVDIIGGEIRKDNLITTTVEISNSYRRTILRKGDLVIALRGKIGALAVITEELAHSNLTRGVALIALRQFADVNFFYQQLSSNLLKSILKKGMNGSALQEISIGTLRKIPVLFPPLPEQRAIAEVLGCWDKAIDRLSALIAQKEARKKWLMQVLLTGKRRLPGFEGEWRSVRLGEVFDERVETGRGDLKLLAITGSQGIIDRDELEKRDSSNNDKSKYRRIAPGDIGYNTMRLWQGVASLSALEGIVSPAYTIITPRDTVDAEFMSYLFKTAPMINQFYRHSQGLVDDTRNCKYPHFAQIKVSIPNRDEQKAISKVLSVADSEIRQLLAQNEVLKEQKKGLMQVLLTGRKRLNHD